MREEGVKREGGEKEWVPGAVLVPTGFLERVLINGGGGMWSWR